MKKIILLITIILFVACNKNEKLDSPDSINQETLDEISTSYNVYDYRATKYLDFFAKTDNTFGATALKPTPLKNSNIFLKANVLKAETVPLVKLNNVSFEEGRKTLKNSDELFGSEVNFKLVTHKKQNNRRRDTIINFYSPKLLHITNPAISNLDERYPLCDANNFVIEWNADIQNTEGLYLVIRYDGVNVLENFDNNLVRNVDYIIQDNGHSTINPAMFDNIPNMSIVEIILLRGNIKMETINDETYKFFTETHASIKCILVKDQSKIEIK